jgi:DNA-binding MarR family transcriptional regulator
MQEDVESRDLRGNEKISMKYTRLRQAIAEAERKHGLHELDHVMRELLHDIAQACMNNERLRVSHLAKDSVHGTFPTLNSRLKKLIEGGWIERKDDESDKRSVLLEVTPKTIDAFKSISNALDTQQSEQLDS